MNDIDRPVWRKSTRSNGGSGCVEVALPAWRTSTRSEGGSGCVEVGLGDHCVGVRDSKDRGGPALWFPETAWADFLTAARAGEFDLPARS